jgi:hypothetical protein
MPQLRHALEVKLATTQSITCSQCNTVVDVSARASAATWRTTSRTTWAWRPGAADPAGQHGHAGAGHAQAPLPWQVVGYLERCDLPAPGDDESRCSGASTCSTTAATASPSWSTPKTAGAGCGRSPACPRRSRATRSWRGIYRKHLQLRRQGHLGAGRVLLARRSARKRRASPTTMGSGNASGRRLSREKTANARGLVGRRDPRCQCGGPRLRHRRPGSGGLPARRVALSADASKTSAKLAKGTVLWCCSSC